MIYDCCPILETKQKITKFGRTTLGICLRTLSCFHLNALSAFTCNDGLGSWQDLKDGSVVNIERQQNMHQEREKPLML